MVSGIWGGDIQRLSLKACFPLIDQLKNSKKSLILELLKHKKKYPASILSFKTGLSKLPLKIAEKLKGTILLNTQVKSIDFDPKPRIHWSNQSMSADHLFSALPAHALYPLLNEKPIQHLSFLQDLRSVSFKILHLGFSKKIPHPPGFGFLTPSFKNEKIAGVIFDSSIFPSHGSRFQSRLTAMIHQNSSIYPYEESLLIKEVLKELEQYFKTRLEPPSYQKMHLVDKAIPQYEVGHLKKLKLFEEELKEKLPHFSFIGSSFYGVSIPSCIHQGKVLAENYLKQTLSS